jgi:hypothetical protein
MSFIYGLYLANLIPRLTKSMLPGVKPFPLYEDIYDLVHGVIATGAGAFHAGGTLKTPAPISDEESTDVGNTSLEVSDQIFIVFTSRFKFCIVCLIYTPISQAQASTF